METQDTMGVVLAALESATPAERPAIRARLLEENFSASEIDEAMEWLSCSEEPVEGELEELANTKGRYLQIYQGLGEGAQGVVDVAFDQYLLRYVAIKRFHSTSLANIDLARREAASLARILHPSVAVVFDVVEEDDSEFGIVMQLSCERDLMGELSLDDIGRPLCVTQHDPDGATIHPASVDEIIGWMIDIADGLHQLHRCRVYHRDIKPSNLLATQVGREVMLVDFGIAVNDDAALAGTAGWRPTRTSAADGARVDRVGTVPWMAPEVARKDAPHTYKANTQIDVYSLGATMYTLIAGHAPQCPSTGEDPPGDLLQLRGSEPHIPLAALPNPRFKVDQRLSAIVEKAMEFRLEHRYSTASDFAADLVAYRAGRLTSADKPLTRVWFQLRSRPLAVAGAITFYIFVVAGASLLPSLLRESNLGKREAGVERRETLVKLKSNAFLKCERSLAAVTSPEDVMDAISECRRRIRNADDRERTYKGTSPGLD